MKARSCVAPATPTTSSSSFGELFQGFRRKGQQATQPTEETTQQPAATVDRSGLLLESWQMSRYTKARMAFEQQ